MENRRRHLRVVQDDGGSPSLVLNAPLFEQSWSNRLVLDAANATFSHLRGGIDLARVRELMDQLLAEDSKLAEEFIAESALRVECAAGCDHCCHQPVGVTAPEALQVYAFLQEQRSEQELDTLRQELRARSQEIRGLSTRERYSPHHPCPLLKEGSCSVYPARPLACRGMNSVDRADCESRLRDPVRREEFLRTGDGGRVLAGPLLASQAISAGLQLTLFEHFGLDMRQLDLIWALDLLLTHGPEVARDWLAGAGSFEPALGASD